jgi:hypothetical protein
VNVTHIRGYGYRSQTHPALDTAPMHAIRLMTPFREHSPGVNKGLADAKFREKVSDELIYGQFLIFTS